MRKEVFAVFGNPGACRAAAQLLGDEAANGLKDFLGDIIARSWNAQKDASVLWNCHSWMFGNRVLTVTNFIPLEPEEGAAHKLSSEDQSDLGFAGLDAADLWDRGATSYARCAFEFALEDREVPEKRELDIVAIYGDSGLVSVFAQDPEEPESGEPDE
jgi:hypothetical protein